MGEYTQENRPISVTTPLGKDVLLLIGFEGHEAVSQLFRFQLEMLSDRKTPVSFDAIVGQPVTVELELAGGGKRYVNGIVSRFSQGDRDETFTRFRAEVVPKLWLLTRKVQSRIFQHLTVPDILKKALTGMSVTYELVGHYEPRDYCVQYRESDFAFASRLMEEEGIYYFFKHSKGDHAMVVTDQPQQHPDVPGPTSVVYEELIHGGKASDMRVIAWEKTQELRSGKLTLWDHCFELPGKNLEAQQLIRDSVAVGKVSHKLKIANNDALEIYEFPGAYAQRFDGVDKGGGDRPADLQKIFTDNQRTVKIRMEQEELPSLEIRGLGSCGHFTAGHKFMLTKHFDGDGSYLLTRVEHKARLGGDYRAVGALPFSYQNRFVCIPGALPYRTPRATPRPTIDSIQTATVVGPPGEEIFVDKYGRVKVQFHWDRQGKKDVDSSCWVRVAQLWAGKGWGSFFWPRIGNEVVVSFQEGDPDQPLILGSVYNAENMPPFTLPLKKQLGGIKSASVRGKVFENYNGIVFWDEKGHEHLAIHSERHMSFNAEFDKMFTGGRHKNETVAGTSMATVGGLPIGGGSGGGPEGYNPLAHTPPAGVPALNAIMVYGENLQAALGLNTQIAVGNNMQLCVNPLGLLAGIPGLPAAPLHSGFLGAGIGGNLQMTLGTNTNIVMGQSYNIVFGPPAINFTNKYADHPASTTVCGLIGCLAIAWLIVYGTEETVSDRVTSTIIFQTAIDLLMMTLMVIETAYAFGNEANDKALHELFRVGQANQSLDANNLLMALSFFVELGILAMIAAPLIGVSKE